MHVWNYGLGGWRERPAISVRLDASVSLVTFLQDLYGCSTDSLRVVVFAPHEQATLEAMGKALWSGYEKTKRGSECETNGVVYDPDCPAYIILEDMLCVLENEMSDRNACPTLMYFDHLGRRDHFDTMGIVLFDETFPDDGMSFEPLPVEAPHEDQLVANDNQIDQ